MDNIEIVADVIKKSKYCIGFTGAGISVVYGQNMIRNL